MSDLNPPYPFIRESLARGEVIPFLGAGASLAGGVQWTQDATDSLPTGGDLARHLAQMAGFPEHEESSLPTVAQYFNVAVGRKDLHRELHEIFARDYQPGSLHSFLAAVETPLLIVTTNYDDLLERAFSAAGRRYDLVIHTSDPTRGDRLLWWPSGETEPQEVSPNKLFVEIDSVAVIYKMHGAVDRGDPQRDQYVITEDDYIDFLTRMTKKKAIPAMFAEPFQTRHFLFLGYGLRDWNLRVVLNRIERDLRRTEDITSWAIDANPSRLETRFWQERRVEVYRLSIDEFVHELQAA